MLTLHGTEVIYMQHARRRRLLDLLGFWQPGWARWIGNSRYTRDLALRAFPLAPRDVAAVPLGVADEWRAGRVDRTRARASLGLGDEAVIVSLGRLVPRKGHAVLAEALALLPPALAAHVRWWVIGPSIDGEHAQALRARAATLPVSTEFLGALSDDDLKRRLSAADLFCLPGYQDEEGRVEGFGLVFLEAGAYGLPSVATRSGGIAEAIEDGETGLLVPERDALALARALERLLADEPLRLRMAVAAEGKAAKATWHRVMEETYGTDGSEPVKAARDD
jgi:glycosyltransferase involved in cell wall biosynthesis